MTGELDLTMEQLLKAIAGAKQALEENQNDDKNVDSYLLTSQQGILRVADKLVKGSFVDDAILPEAREIPLLEDSEHDFVLGDWVEIKYNRADFKSIQKRSLGWNTRLSTIYGHRGVVTQVSSKYNNSIQLHFPEMLAECTLYAPVLRKIDPAELEKLPSRWNPGDLVKVVPDSSLAQILQRGYEDIPKKHLGAIGRVTAVTKKAVDVTFDEQQSQHVHPAALLPCSDTSPIMVQEIKHPRGFKVGQRTKMIKNMKELVGNQKRKKLAWSTNMLRLRGQEVTIVDIQADGTVSVQPNKSPAWRVDADSVLKLDEDEQEYSEELEFLPGDIVKFQNQNDLRRTLTSKDIPLSFLEYMQSSAEVIAVDDDLNIYVSFHANIIHAVNTRAIRKATASEVEKHTAVKNAVKELKVSDRVHLDVGPPNYVRDVLAAAKVDASIKMAMTRSATLVGFTDPDHAVIEYDNRTRYKIKKMFLTVPEKFKISVTHEGVEWKTVQEIQESVSNYVREAHEKEDPANEDWKVEILAMLNGVPPSVDIKVQSLIADAQGAYNWLHGNSGWDIELISQGHLLIKGVKGYKGGIKLAIFFNDEDIGTGATASEVTTTFEERNLAEVEVQPIQKEHRRPQVHGLVLNDHSSLGTTKIETHIQQQRVMLENLNGFRFLKLSDPSLGQDVYFPYMVGGQPRIPVYEDHAQQQSQYNIFHISNSNIGHVGEFLMNDN